MVWGTGQALLRSPKGRNASRDGFVKLGLVRCLQYTVNCFQYNVWDLCGCESSNRNVICDKPTLCSCLRKFNGIKINKDIRYTHARF